MHKPLIPPELVQYVDAEYGRNHKSGNSDEGQIIILNGNIVSWSMKAQTMEIIALSNGATQLLKSRNYIDASDIDLDPTPGYEDNMMSFSSRRRSLNWRQ